MRLKNEIKATLKLAIPIMGAQFLSIVMVVTDNIMVGRLGREALGGLALAGSFYSFIVIIIVGLMGALSALVSREDGAGRHERAGRYLRQALFLSVFVTAVLATGLVFAEEFLLAIGQLPETSAIATEYLHAMIWTVPAQLAFLSIRNFCEGTGDSVPSVIIAAVIAVLNVPLDYALIFGYGPFPAMGVEGAAYATASLTWLSLFALTIYVATHTRYTKYRLFDWPPRPDARMLKDIVWLGVPFGGAVATEMGFFGTTTFLMGRLGEVELAAHQVALNSAALVFMIPLGLSFAVSIRIGQQLGAGSREGARDAWLSSLVIVGIVQTVMAAVFLTFPATIVSLYGQDGQVESLAVELLMIAGFFQLFDGFQVVGMGALRGLREAKFALWATSIAFWVIGAATVAWAYVNQWAPGIWFGLLTGLAIASLAHHTRAWFVLRPQNVLS
ncbi:MAG: MATE family efflux transporter [bacterium]